MEEGCEFCYWRVSFIERGVGKFILASFVSSCSYMYKDRGTMCIECSGVTVRLSCYCGRALMESKYNTESVPHLNNYSLMLFIRTTLVDRCI